MPKMTVPKLRFYIEILRIVNQTESGKEFLNWLSEVLKEIKEYAECELSL